MRLHRAIAGCLALNACAPAAPAVPDGPRTASIAIIPRQHTLSANDQRRVEGMDYDPVDLPMAFTPRGDLVIVHREQYSISDTGWEVCAPTGFYLVPRDGGVARPLATGREVCHVARHASVSADGAWAVFTPNPHPAGLDFVRAQLATGRLDTLRTGSGLEFRDPAFSADGGMIAALGRDRDRDRDPESWSLYVMNSDGSGVRNIGTDGRSPLWSPDGKRLAFNRRGRELEVVVMDVDGANARTVGRGRLLAWSPDGEWLALLRWDRAIQIVRTDGTGARVLYSAPPERRPLPGSIPRRIRVPEWKAAWAPDSRSLVFSRMQDAGISIWRVDVATRRLTRVTRPES